MPSPEAGRGAPSLTQRFLQAILRKWRYHTQNKLQQTNTTRLALQIIYKQTSLRSARPPRGGTCF